MLETILQILTIASLIPAVQAGSPVQGVSSYEHVFDTSNSEVIQAPVRRDVERVGLVTTSPSIFAADVSTGTVLYSDHAHDVRPIASLTKLVTAMVVLDHSREHMDEEIQMFSGDLEDDLHFTLYAGDVITKRQALEALLVGSVNSAGNALARETLGREEFVRAMNEKVRELNLASPHFVDPTGISTENRASAADVAALLTIALSYPEIREITHTPQVDLETKGGDVRRVFSTNLLLSSYLNQEPYSIVGAKTGSLPDAGYSMAQVTRNPQGREVVVVILGNPDHFSRFAEMKRVTSWVFDVFEWTVHASGN